MGFLMLVILLAAAAAPLQAQDVPPDDDPRRPQEPPRPDRSAGERLLGFIGRTLKTPFEMAGTALEGTLIPIEEERGGFAAGLSAAAAPAERKRGLSFIGGSLGTRSGFLGGGVKLTAAGNSEGPQLGATAAATNRGYQLYTAYAGWNDPDEHPYIRAMGFYDLDTMNEFWGIGPESTKEDESGFSWEKLGAIASAGIPERRGIWGRAYVSYERTSVFDSYQIEQIDIGDAFPDDVFPELELWGPGATVALDFRDSQGYPKSGVLLTGTGEMWRSLGDEEANWIRYAAEASGHVPLGSDWHILSAKAGVDVVEPDSDEDIIPFPYLPALGGSQTLRGFSSWRWRDRAAAYATAEFRWRIWLEHAREEDQAGALETALFYDVGQVGPELGDLKFEDREVSYGLILRFYVVGGHLMTAGVGRSDEATRFVFTTNNSW
jgi:hypothetical protein